MPHDQKIGEIKTCGTSICGTLIIGPFPKRQDIPSPSPLSTGHKTPMKRGGWIGVSICSSVSCPTRGTMDPCRIVICDGWNGLLLSSCYGGGAHGSVQKRLLMPTPLVELSNKLLCSSVSAVIKTSSFESRLVVSRILSELLHKLEHFLTFTCNVAGCLWSLCSSAGGAQVLPSPIHNKQPIAVPAFESVCVNG